MSENLSSIRTLRDNLLRTKVKSFKEYSLSYIELTVVLCKELRLGHH